MGVLMELTIGNTVKYNFPIPANSEENFFIGVIEVIGDTFLTIRNSKNTLLKVSFKNFENIMLLENSNHNHSYTRTA